MGISRRIIVLGVSGVGKTTVCARFARTHPEYLHLTASQLIVQETGKSLSDLQASDQVAVLANQIALRNSLGTKIAESSASGLLLDGQCLVDNGRELIPIPTASIASLEPTAFILLEAEPSLLFNRRRSDGKHRPLRSPDELVAQMNECRKIVATYSRELSVPFVVRDVSSKDVIADAINGLGIAT